MSQEDMDKVLDDLEGKLEDNKADQEVQEDHEVQDEVVETASNEDDDTPDGFMSYEDWVESGKDPKKYRGEEAFEAHGKTLSEVKDLKQTINAMVEAMEEWKVSQKKQENDRVEQARLEAQQALDKAREDEDVDAVIEAKDRLHKLDSKNDQDDDRVDNRPNPVIMEFSKAHPIIDQSSSQFDQDFYDDMSMFQGTILDKMTGRDPERVAALKPRQIERSMEIAYAQAKEMHPDKFRSKRNTRQAQPTTVQKRTTQTISPVDKLKGYGRNSKNQRDTEPAMDIYNLLKSKSPEAAETFLKNLTQE